MFFSHSSARCARDWVRCNPCREKGRGQGVRTPRAAILAPPFTSSLLRDWSSSLANAASGSVHDTAIKGSVNRCHVLHSTIAGAGVSLSR